jgi:hypothetical protein
MAGPVVEAFGDIGLPGGAEDSHRGRERLVVIGVIVLVLVVVAASIAVSGGKLRVRSAGPFAGYTWQGAVVNSMSGSWTQPKIVGGRPRGVAATWIGAQASAAGDSPFIQIGVSEQRDAALVPARDSGSVDPYFAFWSDTMHGFHPVGLFAVDPGDVIVTSMVLRRGRWTLFLDDETLNETATVTTRQEAQGRFKIAEWTQEDVTDGATNTRYPYPRLTGFTFRELRVNSQSPNAVDLEPVAMAENGTVLTPSAVQGDAFAVGA